MKLQEIQPKIALKKILFATDFGNLCDRALRFAVAFAERHEAKLCISHVIPESALAFAHPDSLEHITKETHDFASYKLKQIASQVKRRGLACEMMMDDGNPGEVILGLAREQSIDLIVVGTSSRAGLGKLFVGSVAEQIIREAPCPVLTIGPQAAIERAGAIRNILCAVDFSPSSLRTTEFACSLRRQYQAHLALVHVIDNIKDSRVSSVEAGQELLRNLATELDLQYEARILAVAGPVAVTILQVALKSSADLLAMGAHGVGAFAETASHFGSIVYKVVSLAPCPVLTVAEQQKRPID
jgi:nucleotide-binding universal stress UspA family protein